jgi:hypothetical protein
MSRFHGVSHARGLVVFLALTGSGAARAQELGPTIDVRAGQAVAFSATIAGDSALTGPPRLSKAGAASPKDSEIVVSVAPPGLSPYAMMTVTETTARPIDFYATGFIDRIKIDDVHVCGHLDAPASARIAAGARRIALNHFIARKAGEACP